MFDASFMLHLSLGCVCLYSYLFKTICRLYICQATLLLKCIMGVCWKALPKGFTLGKMLIIFFQNQPFNMFVHPCHVRKMVQKLGHGEIRGRDSNEWGIGITERRKTKPFISHLDMPIYVQYKFGQCSHSLILDLHCSQVINEKVEKPRIINGCKRGYWIFLTKRN